MRIYKELKKIACLNSKIQNLAKTLKDKLDCDDLDIGSAYLIDGCSEKGGHLYRHGVRLDNHGNVDDDYYCFQQAGYCEDDFFGTLYFKTNVPGQFVAVPFAV